jgi:predicted permease
VVGRLKDGVSVTEAQSELDPLTQRLVAADPEAGSEYLATGAYVTSLRQQTVGDARQPLVLLLGAAAFVLLVACTNLASTFLARGTTRAREVAVRSALGAHRTRILRLLLTEASLLAGLGGVAGIGLALGLLQGIRALGGEAIPRLDTVMLDGSVLLFALGVTAATALLFGLLPALKTLENDQAQTLRSEGRGSEGYRGRAWGALVMAEVALALVLLTGSGLLIRSFTAVLAQDGGFDDGDVALTTLALSGIKYPELEDHARFWDEMLARAEAVPGVGAAGVMTSRPVSGFAPNGRVELDGDPEKFGDANYVVASEGAFRALDIPLLRGRLFDATDGPEGQHVAVVSESFADRYWPGEDPIGKLVSGGGMDNFWSADPPRFGRVVGVVGEVRFRELSRAGYPTVYWSFRQRPARVRYGGILVAESASGDPGMIISGLRTAIREADADVAVRFGYLSDMVSDSVAQRRFILIILSGFAGAALLLAGVGIYGVVSYSVARRFRETGIRLALGATRSGVRTMVVTQALRPVALGLVLGLAGTFALSRVMGGLLYQVRPTDPATLGAVVLILFVTAWGASWIPALRSTRVDPGVTMRAE